MCDVSAAASGGLVCDVSAAASGDGDIDEELDRLLDGICYVSHSS